MDRGVWGATVERVVDSRTWLSTHTPTHEAKIWERMTTTKNKLERGNNKFHKSIKCCKHVYIGNFGSNQVWANIWINMREGNIHRAGGRTFAAKSAEHTRAEQDALQVVKQLCWMLFFFLFLQGNSAHDTRGPVSWAMSINMDRKGYPLNVSRKDALSICKQNIHLLQGGSLLSENHCVSKAKDWQWAGTLHPGSTQASGHHSCSGCLLGHTPREGGWLSTISKCEMEMEKERGRQQRSPQTHPLEAPLPTV